MRRNFRRNTCLLALFIVIFIIYLYMLMRSSHDQYINEFSHKPKYNVKQPYIKYILQWSSPDNVPFVYMGKGLSTFLERKCPFFNCYVTSDREYFDDYTKFDAIAFHGPEIESDLYDLPIRRSLNQKYVFASIESSDNYPVCASEVDNFFNWTWTFKLTSDARWGYIIIRDSNKKIIGPRTDMHWLKKDEMAPVSEDFKEKLKNKTKAAAWFVSNCRTARGREVFVMMLNKQLQRYGLNVDVYGKCGSLSCPSDKHDECIKLIERDYYFYLSFENSFSEDYVTEKLLHPLQNNAVPIVFGGANYTRHFCKILFGTCLVLYWFLCFCFLMF